MMVVFRRYALLLALVALGLALRLPALDRVPNPSGDEGNWTWIAYDLYAHRPASLPPDASFVSLAFARMIALAYALVGPSFAAARGVLVVAMTMALVASWALARRLAAPRAAWVIALVLAMHPWSVLWSRTATVPYALSLALAVVAPLAALDALQKGCAWRTLLASQLLGASMHFSPLGVIPIVAVFVEVWRTAAHHAPAHRWPWRVLAAVSGALHVVPMLIAAFGVVRLHDTHTRHYFSAFACRVYVYLRSTLGALDGEATLRHFTGTEATLMGELSLAAAAVVVIVATLRGTSPLARYARTHLALAFVGLPLVLAPARPWNLPAIDAERYGFVVLAPFALCLGALAERSRRARIVVAGALLLFAATPTARLGEYFVHRGSPDRGFYTLAGGGGYRGWKITREPVALPVLLRREVDRVRGSEPAQIVVADYAFHPLHFVNAEGGSPTTDILKFSLTPRPGVLHAFVLWSDGLFAPGFAPRDSIDGNAQLGALMRSSRFRALRRGRVFTQPDGSPLCELWFAVGAP
jgi:hypothetical protein